MSICLFDVNAANISETQLIAQFEIPFQSTDILTDIITLHVVTIHMVIIN